MQDELSDKHEQQHRADDAEGVAPQCRTSELPKLIDEQIKRAGNADISQQR